MVNIPSRESVLIALGEVLDPEVPALSIVELGMVREVVVENDSIRIDITPTYSGCPALDVIQKDILARLGAEGWSKVELNLIYSPPWTTDWMSDDAKEKLRRYGIAPPGAVPPDALISLPQKKLIVKCPHCSSADTVLESQFGATACKSFYYCKQCMQPFEYFKAI